jgi:hypothetical protein
LALFAGARADNDLGFAAAVDIDVVQNVKNYALPYIANVINNLEISDMDTDDYQIDNIRFELDPIDVEDATVVFNETYNGIHLSADNIGGHLRCHVRITYLWIFNVHGKLDLNMNNAAKIRANIALGSQTSTDGTKQVFATDFQVFHFNLDKKDVSIELSGNFAADMANGIIWLFEDFILQDIVDAVNGNVPSVMNTLINQMLRDTNGVLSLYEGVYMDTSLTRTPVVLNNQLDLYLNGTIFNSAYGEVGPDVGFAEATIDLTTSACVQLDLSAHVVDSLF